VTFATRKQVQGIQRSGAREGDRLNESTIRPEDANLVKVTAFADPSRFPIVIDTSTESDGGNRSGGY
jgi:hypothetical protein